jgi:hypothetical protein
MQAQSNLMFIVIRLSLDLYKYKVTQKVAQAL